MNPFVIAGSGIVLFIAGYILAKLTSSAGGLDLEIEDFNCDSKDATVKITNGPVDWVVAQVINLDTEAEPEIPDWTKAKKHSGPVGNGGTGTVIVTDIPTIGSNLRVVVWSLHKHDRKPFECA